MEYNVPDRLKVLLAPGADSTLVLCFFNSILGGMYGILGERGHKTEWSGINKSVTALSSFAGAVIIIAPPVPPLQP